MTDLNDLYKKLKDVEKKVNYEIEKEQKEIISKEVIKLERMIVQSWDTYLSSYTSSGLIPRTGKTRKGIKAKTNIESNFDSYIGSVGVNHISGGFTGNYPINPYLNMSTGWQWSNGRLYAYRFTHYDGFNQMATVKNQWERQNKNNWLKFDWEIK